MVPDLRALFLDQRAAWCRPGAGRRDGAALVRGPAAGAKEIYLLGILPELLSPSTSPSRSWCCCGEGADAKASGLLWTAIGLTQDPEPRLRFVIQGKGAASTQALNELGKNVLQYLRQVAQADPAHLISPSLPTT